MLGVVQSAFDARKRAPLLPPKSILLLCAALLLVLATPTGARSEEALLLEWKSFKANYLLSDGRVVDRENGGISHTEGQGWAMIMAAKVGDRAAFDKIWAWTEAVLSRRDIALFSWKYDPYALVPANDRNNATDGDLSIAWALLLAGQRWHEPAYTSRSWEIRNAILAYLVKSVGGYKVLSPGLEGFARDKGRVVNLSYTILPALQDFHASDPRRGWDQLIRDHDRLLFAVTEDGSKLPPDWLLVGYDGSLEPAPGWPPQFGFDAVRVPLYLTWAGSSQRLISSLAHNWLRSSGSIAIPAWVDLVSGGTSSYPACGGVQRIWHLAAHPHRHPETPAGNDESYYSAALTILSHFAFHDRLIRIANNDVPTWVRPDMEAGLSPASGRTDGALP